MNEFELIARLTHALPMNESVVTGAGDDCAVLDLGVADKLILFKTDAVVEGFHFTRETPPEKIGRKALARCLSDIAAMAGTPTAALVTIALPEKFDAEFVAKIYNGMNALAREHGVAIVGGETTTNPERILISISLLGTVSARQTDFAERRKDRRRDFCDGRTRRFARGKASGVRAAPGRGALAGGAFFNSCDDGFERRAGRRFAAYFAGERRRRGDFEISRAGFARGKIAREARFRPPNPRSPPRLTDGEDFELLFTIAGKDAVKLLDAWKKKFPDLRLSCIGKIVAGDGILIRDKSGSHKLNARGYVHFAKSRRRE